MLVGIDIGQSACKVTALDAEGAVLGSRSAGYPTLYPQTGWAEQDPASWLDALERACSALVESLPRRRIDGIGVTGATHNAVLLGANGRPLRRTILLSDARAVRESQALESELGGYIFEHTRNAVTPGWTLPQLCWVARRHPTIWARLHRVLFAKDYVRKALTGIEATDRIDAEGSLFFDSHTRQWEARLCDQVPLPAEALPPVVDPFTIVGDTSRDADRFRLPPGIPVIAGCSDTAAEAFSAGANTSGDGLVKLGTSGNYNIVTVTPVPSRQYFTYSHPVSPFSYHSFGTNAATASRAWFHRILGDVHPTEASYSDLDAEIAKVPPGSHGVLFHPYLAGERAPVFDTTLRGSFVGLSSHHSRAHLARAVLEGVALSLSDCASVAAASGLHVSSLRLIGGGAISDVWAQIVSDVFGREVIRPAISDASGGAALLAGVGVGTFRDLSEATAIAGRVRSLLHPDPRAAAEYSDLLSYYRAIRDVVAPLVRHRDERQRPSR